MIIYIIVFIISLLFLYFSEKVEKKSKVLKFVFVLLSLITVSLLACNRAETIGTDILVYVKPYFDYIKNYGVVWLYRNSNCEILYLFLNYLIIIVGGNFKVLLFTITFLISLIYYIYAKENRESNILITYSVYLFVIFGITLNLVRQSIAMVIVLYSTKYLKKHQFKRYLMMILIACGFHSTAIIMIALYFIYCFFGTNFENLVKMIISLISLIIVFLSKEIINYLYVFFNKFDSNYIERYINHNLDFNLSWEIVKITIFIVLMVLLKYNKERIDNKYDKNYFHFCKFLLILDLIFFQLGAIFKYSERFSYYFMLISYSYLFPCLLDVFINKDDRKGLVVSYFIVFLLLVVYFVVIYVFLKISSIVPFQFG